MPNNNRIYVEAKSLDALIGTVAEEFSMDSIALGCIYAFDVGNSIKVGVSRDIVSRLTYWNSVFCNLPFDIKNAASSIPHELSFINERRIHKIFRDKAVRKEFFAVTMDDFYHALSYVLNNKINDEDIPELYSTDDCTTTGHGFVIKSWPSMRALAEDIGVSENNVYAWHRRDRIPSGYWFSIVKAAKKRKLKNITIKFLTNTTRPRAVRKIGTDAGSRM